MIRHKISLLFQEVKNLSRVSDNWSHFIIQILPCSRPSITFAEHSEELRCESSHSTTPSLRICVFLW